MTAHNESYLNIGDATIDLDREERCGFSEVIYGESKTADAIERIALAQIERGIDGVLQPGRASDSRPVAASS